MAIEEEFWSVELRLSAAVSAAAGFASGAVCWILRTAPLRLGQGLDATLDQLSDAETFG